MYRYRKMKALQIFLDNSLLSKPHSSNVEGIKDKTYKGLSTAGKVLKLLEIDSILKLFISDEIDPYYIYLDIIYQSLGKAGLTDTEFNKLKSKEKFLSKKTKYSVDISGLLEQKHRMIFSDLKFSDIINSYRSRRLNLNKDRSSAEKNAWKTLNPQLLSNFAIEEYTDEEIIEVSNAPILISNKDKVIYTEDIDTLDITALSDPTNPALEFYTGHISSFIFKFLYEYTMSEKHWNIYYPFYSTTISDEQSKFLLLILEIERRLYNCKNIAEYLEPVIKLNSIYTKNYVLFRINSPSGEKLSVFIYKGDVSVIVESKYENILKIDQLIREDDMGRAIIKDTGEKLWDIVYKGVYVPKKNNNGECDYNFIVDSCRE